MHQYVHIYGLIKYVCRRYPCAESTYFGTEEEEEEKEEEREEEVPLRIEKVIKKVRINRKSHSNFVRALYS